MEGAEVDESFVIFPTWMEPLLADDEGMPTETSVKQADTEAMCARYLFPASKYSAVRDLWGDRSGDHGMGGPHEDTDEIRVQEPRERMFTASGAPRLFRSLHMSYAGSRLRGMHPGMQGLDASRPFLSYWRLHALDLLDQRPTDHAFLFESARTWM
jgi:hypothetical protein